MLFNSKDLSFAAGARSPHVFLNDCSRYDLRIEAIKRVRGRNRYNAEALGKAYLCGTLEKQMVPTAYIPELFSRIDWTAYSLEMDQLVMGEIDQLYVAFPCFHPHDDFSGIITDPAELPAVLEEIGHVTLIDLGDFIKAKLDGWI